MTDSSTRYRLGQQVGPYAPRTRYYGCTHEKLFPPTSGKASAQILLLTATAGSSSRNIRYTNSQADIICVVIVLPIIGVRNSISKASDTKS